MHSDVAFVQDRFLCCNTFHKMETGKFLLIVFMVTPRRSGFFRFSGELLPTNESEYFKRPNEV